MLVSRRLDYRYRSGSHESHELMDGSLPFQGSQIALEKDTLLRGILQERTIPYEGDIDDY